MPYDAFISYRRHDGRSSARRLRRRLLDYRLAEAFKTTASRARLTVYLDTIYERASDDFFEKTVKPALADSSHLIVVFTPGTLQPRTDGTPNWVEREIAYFRTLPQGDNVSVALVRGTFDGPLPADLHRDLPNVQRVDVRRLRWPGWLTWPLIGKTDEGVLQFIATLYGISASAMPELRQEEARRRAVRAGIWATAAVTVSLALIGLSTWALFSLAETRRQSTLYTTLLGRATFETSPARARLQFARAREIANETPLLARLFSIDSQLADAWLGRAYPEQVEAVLWHSAPVRWAAFSADGRHVVTTCTDGSVSLWNPATGERMVGPLAHASGHSVSHASFRPDGRRFATASSDGTVVM